MEPSAADIEKCLSPILVRFARMHPLDQINLARNLNDALHDGEAAIAAIRRQAVRTLRSDGWTLKEIAEETNMTPPRVLQIERGSGRKEKADKAK